MWLTRMRRRPPACDEP